MRDFRKVACAAGLIALSLPATAHHSFSMFDFTQHSEVTGTVESFQWTNPHVWLNLKITADDGTEELWHFEAAAPGHLVRYGWRSTAMQPGDEVTITMRPLKKAGQRAGQLIDVTLADGTYLGGSAPPPGIGAPGEGAPGEGAPGDGPPGGGPPR